MILLNSTMLHDTYTVNVFTGKNYVAATTMHCFQSDLIFNNDSTYGGNKKRKKKFNSPPTYG